MKNQTWVIVAVVVAVVALLCCCISVAGLIGWNIIRSDNAQEWTQSSEATAIAVPEEQLPTQDNPPSSNLGPGESVQPAGDGAKETLQTLESSLVPENEPDELAERLGGKTNVPEVVSTTPKIFEVGDQQTFWVSDTVNNDNFQVDAKLQYVTPHLYFWIENGVTFKERELKRLCEAFESKIYPTNREFFGSEWTPGVDGDVHLYILFARGVGGSVVGYFSSGDEVSPLAHPYSNAHEMFILNADNAMLGDEYTYGVLAHEFQHMIHWYRDRNEESWLNEGFSELASLLNGYDPGTAHYVFMSDPDLQLNDWPNDSDATYPHYGSGLMFTTYFLDRFGEDATKALVADPANGLDSVDDVLKQIGATDPATGKPLTADDVFADWVVANYINDSGVAEGQYAYRTLDQVPQVGNTEYLTDCSGSMINSDVSQYGADYIEINCTGDTTLTFQGSTTVGVLSESPHSGDYAFWSNKGDESDITLTREFDFTDVSAPLEMKYSIWYDLEKDYDYLYLTASVDGKTWQIVDTPSCTTNNPSGNSYGCGYNGVSDGWVTETVDLSAFAGEKVRLRFEYITDAAVNGEGLLLDDVSIPAINYASDFESDDGGWAPSGFVRIQNVLPQTYRVTVIQTHDGKTTVTPMELSDTASGKLNLQIKGGDRTVVVVSGTTPFTRQKATYSLEVR